VSVCDFIIFSIFIINLTICHAISYMLCHVSANLAIVCSVTVDILLFYVVGGKIATYNITVLVSICLALKFNERKLASLARFKYNI